jgi:hypothetical protein
MSTSQLVHRCTVAVNKQLDPQLPDHVRGLLESCPRSGQGVHDWLFPTAKALHRFYKDAEVIHCLLAEATKDCGRTVDAREISDAITNSAAALHRELTSLEPTPPRWPRANREEIAKIVADGATVESLRRGSSVSFGENAGTCSDEVIDILFPGNQLLCVGKDTSKFKTLPRENWRGKLGEQQFIVPNPMTSKWGMTKAGRPSQHALSNTGPRKFLVTEFDPDKWEDLTEKERCCYTSKEHYADAKRDEHAAVISRLSRCAPLVLVVNSGGKSLHAWWHCEGQTEDRLLRFMRSARALGADHKTWSKSQFVRLPGGCRPDGRRQPVIFFNPAAMKGNQN